MIAFSTLMIGVAAASGPAGGDPPEAGTDDASEEPSAPATPTFRVDISDLRELIPVPGGASFVARTETGLRLIDLRDGAQLGAIEIDVVAVRPTGDGALWVCGGAGVSRIAVEPQGFGAPKFVASEPCRELVGVPDAGGCDTLIARLNGGLLGLPVVCPAERDGGVRSPPSSAVPEAFPRRPEEPSAALASPSAAPAYGRPGTGSRKRRNYALELGLDTGRLQRPILLESCAGSLGGSVGASWVNLAWRTLGASWLFDASPVIGGSCTFRTARSIGWVVGVETAPFMTYTVDSVLYRSGFVVFSAVGYATDQVFVGGHATGGLTIAAIGPIARYLPFAFPSGSRHGFEARMNWIPARAFVGQLQLSYLIEIGVRRPPIGSAD